MSWLSCSVLWRGLITLHDGETREFGEAFDTKWDKIAGHAETLWTMKIRGHAETLPAMKIFGHAGTLPSMQTRERKMKPCLRYNYAGTFFVPVFVTEPFVLYLNGASNSRLNPRLYLAWDKPMWSCYRFVFVYFCCSLNVSMMDANNKQMCDKCVSMSCLEHCFVGGKLAVVKPGRE